MRVAREGVGLNILLKQIIKLLMPVQGSTQIREALREKVDQDHKTLTERSLLFRNVVSPSTWRLRSHLLSLTKREVRMRKERTKESVRLQSNM